MKNADGVKVSVHTSVIPCKHCNAKQGEEHSVTCPYGVKEDKHG